MRMRHMGHAVSGAAYVLPLLLAMLCFAVQVARADGAPAAAVDHSTRAVALQRDMRQLWDDHVFWTRLVIVSVAANLPDLPAATDRLLQNQVDIGNAIKPYYGEAAGQKLTALLQEHIRIVAGLLVAAKAGDAAKTNDAKLRWYSNGDDIAVFLSGANPRNWPLGTMKAMMRKHLDTTLAEATARMNGDWKTDITAFDAARAHVLMMADALSAGIIHQFPAKFADALDAAPVQVNMADMAFQPQQITVAPGATVQWTDASQRPHTVTADGANAVPGGPDSGARFPNGLQPGDSFTWTVPADAAAGTTWFYHCAFHGAEGDGRSLGRGMSGVIVVQLHGRGWGIWSDAAPRGHRARVGEQGDGKHAWWERPA
jgi:plastocyanin